MSNQFLSPEGELEENFISDYWLLDQYIGDQVWSWGAINGTSGTLGINVSSGSRSTPVSIFGGATNWKSVACGRDHTIAIRTDGTLWTWGKNSQGELGINSTTDRITPVQVSGNNWKQASATDRLSAAIKTDGTLWVWGYNFSGALGNGGVTGVSASRALTPITTFAGGSDWKQVSCGAGPNSVVAAIKTDGTLWTWGDTSNGILGNGISNQFFTSTPITTFAGGNDWKQVSCSQSGRNMMAIKKDGTLWGWGASAGGASGSLGNISTPVTTFAGGNNWKEIGNYCAIKTDGTLWVWGGNLNGALGTNSTQSNVSTPVTTFAGGNNWKSISDNSYDGQAAIKTDGTLWLWGVNVFFSPVGGQLGIFDIISRSTPVTTFAGGSNWKQVSRGAYHTVAVKSGINAQYPLS